ncbi:unnamed protein product [Anisakis simplex]|uniref:Transposase, MuDR, MULE transposase domain protein n=1 Tax=Anisakis simplex TaxID=6269 RepID=A0A0M3JL73_ANISI|nr:unnamed protein product [Anisakis simplex]
MDVTSAKKTVTFTEDAVVHELKDTDVSDEKNGIWGNGSGYGENDNDSEDAADYQDYDDWVDDYGDETSGQNISVCFELGI